MFHYLSFFELFFLHQRHVLFQFYEIFFYLHYFLLLDLTTFLELVNFLPQFTISQFELLVAQLVEWTRILSFI